MNDTRFAFCFVLFCFVFPSHLCSPLRSIWDDVIRYVRCGGHRAHHHVVSLTTFFCKVVSSSRVRSFCVEGSDATRWFMFALCVWKLWAFKAVLGWWSSTTHMNAWWCLVHGHSPNQHEHVLQDFRASILALFTMYCHVGRTSKSVYINAIGSEWSKLGGFPFSDFMNDPCEIWI
jgi:hypothetical protein